MRIHKPEISIPLFEIERDLALCIYEETEKTLFEIDENEAAEFGESRYQILEGRSYNYYFENNNYQLKEIPGIVYKSKRKDVSEGRLTPNIYVGTLTLNISKKDDESKEHPVFLEVLSTKMNSEIDKSYRENYRFMLESITKKCTELLMQMNSPINQYFEPNFDEENKTVYQRFSFVQSLISSTEFNEAVQRIISAPTTKWAEDIELKDVRNIKRFNGSAVRQLISGSNRLRIQDEHFLSVQYNLKDIPTKLLNPRKIETVDTSENRFIKYALSVFMKFCDDCERLFSKNADHLRYQKEAQALSRNIRNHLNHPVFREILRPVTLSLNSPVLQRKSGYREILNAWLMFDLAAKLIWTGGENVYKAGKRDIAVLYEYWLFFSLYDLIKSKFKLDNHSYDDKSYKHLIFPTNDGLNVLVKAGKHTALEGDFDSGRRKLHIKFSYNRTFSGGKEYEEKVRGSWTKTLRPDYTLSVWPSEFSEDIAEEKEIIVYIHFDSKYKVDQFTIRPKISSDSTEEELLNEEKKEERKGIYKNADLLKMHAYKDAIRRTSGAYILYPGTENQKPLRGFHEIIPGLGAFAIRPSEGNNGCAELSDFIDMVITHFLDRASQRENISSKIYSVHKYKKLDFKEDNQLNILNEAFPEMVNGNRLIPDETFVLLGYSTSNERLVWYEKYGIYNFRTDDDEGSLLMDNQVVNSKYLLIRQKSSTTASKIYKILSKGLRVFSKQKLAELNYPFSKSPKEYYLVVDIEKTVSSDFGNVNWEFQKLKKYQQIIEENPNPQKGPGIPFAVSLTELMKVKI